MVCAECPYWEECMGGCRFQKKAEEEPEPEADQPYFSYNYYRNQKLGNFSYVFRTKKHLHFFGLGFIIELSNQGGIQK